MPLENTLEDLNLLRVDQVGSLVVPADLAAASDHRLRGEISEGELRETEDEAIRLVMRKQEQVGLPILTDGEFRRRNFQDSFGNAVSGYDTPSLAGTRPADMARPEQTGQPYRTELRGRRPRDCHAAPHRRAAETEKERRAG